VSIFTHTTKRRKETPMNDLVQAGTNPFQTQLEENGVFEE